MIQVFKDRIYGSVYVRTTYYLVSFGIDVQGWYFCCRTSSFSLRIGSQMHIFTYLLGPGGHTAIGIPQTAPCRMSYQKHLALTCFGSDLVDVGIQGSQSLRIGTSQ